MKKILIPVDFSTTSIKAVEIASNLAQRISAKLVLVHMAGIDEGIINNEPNAQEFIFHAKLAEKKFNELLEKPFLNGITVEPLLRKQIDFAALNTLAQEIDASLVVMGTTGATGLKEVFTGSNAEKVVRNSQVPTIVVKENDLAFSTFKMVFASDFATEAIPAFRKINDVAELLEMQLSCLYVNTPNAGFKTSEAIHRNLTDFFSELGKENVLEAVDQVNLWSDQSVEEGIINFSKYNEIDIIAIPTHGRQGFAHFLNGSISEDLVNHVDLPVLTVKI